MVHELLLSSGDSTSRILPVKQVSEYEYQLTPEKPLAINPDSFVSIVNKTVRQGKLPVSFTASVVKSKNKEMVFGFTASPSQAESDVACVGRNLPEDSYYISFVFSPKSEWSNYLYLGSAALALAGLLFWVKKKKEDSKTVIPIPAEEIREGCIKIGKYLFDPVQQQLELAGEKTPLTIKETKVLQILANAPNTIVERETLQKEVWENEGVIVTRSLDMFISKLRKKLTEDAAVKIVNVHGKGYRLDINR